MKKSIYQSHLLVHLEQLLLFGLQRVLPMHGYFHFGDIKRFVIFIILFFLLIIFSLFVLFLAFSLRILLLNRLVLAQHQLRLYQCFPQIEPIRIHW